jgi:hypothetical protein
MVPHPALSSQVPPWRVPPLTVRETVPRSPKFWNTSDLIDSLASAPGPSWAPRTGSLADTGYSAGVAMADRLASHFHRKRITTETESRASAFGGIIAEVALQRVESTCAVRTDATESRRIDASLRKDCPHLGKMRLPRAESGGLFGQGWLADPARAQGHAMGAHILTWFVT